ncbi:MAG: PQQ-binding-like beta-propeller repeat protein [Verrucomicrobia bacterium]|nr:PQQ-binding-like beta-propeller repeat protein [Verrucomicrobiota bacterium]
MKTAVHFGRDFRFAGRMLGFLVVCTTDGPASDWPCYRGPNHDGVSTDRILKQWPANGPPVLWRVPLTNGFSSLAVSQGRALTLVTRVTGGTTQEVCVALSADTGAELWARPLGPAAYDSGAGTGDGPRSTPTVDGDRVYTLSAYISLACLNVTNGQVIWSKDLRQDYGGSVIMYQNGASVLLDGDLLFANCNNAAGAQALLALRKSDGSLAWKGQTNQMTHATPVLATLGGVRQIIFFTQAGLISVEAQTGVPLWRYAFPYSVSSGASPVVAGDIVVCTAAYPITGAGAVRVALSNSVFTATQLWRTNAATLGAQWCTPIAYGGYLYGFFAQHGSTIYLKCADLATGSVKWSRSTSGSGTAFGMGSLLLVSGLLLVQGETGELALVEPNPTNYVERARAKVLTTRSWNYPAFSNGRLYVRSITEGACLEVSVPPLKMLAPQPGSGNQLQLFVSTTDGRAVDSNRLAGMQVRSATNLATRLTNWTQLTNMLVLTNGQVRLELDKGTQPRRYFITTEPP